jgi:hypothetical protein
MKFLLIKEMPNDGNDKLVDSNMAFKVGVKTGKGVGVIWARFVIEVGNEHEHYEIANQCDGEYYAIEKMDAAPALNCPVNSMVGIATCVIW